MRVDQWIRRAEQEIGRVVVREKLHARCVGRVQGPLTITFCVRLLRPSAAGLRRILALGPAFAQALRVDAVRVTNEARGILIEVPSPEPRTPTAQHLAQHSRGPAVAVGLNQWRQPVRVRLTDHPTLLFVGPSRKGKTQAMQSALYALARGSSPAQFRFAIITKKIADWASWSDVAHCLGVVTDPAETEMALEWFAGRHLQERSAGHIRTPATLIVLDDLLNILDRADIAGQIGELASMGGGVGLYQMIGTQDAGSKRGTGGPAVENNITARVVYRAGDATAAARMAGHGGAGVDALSGTPGDALLIVDGQAQRIATGYLSAGALGDLPTGPATTAPWLGTVVDYNRTTGLQPAATTYNHPQPAVASPPRPAENEATEGGGEAVVERLWPIDKRPLTDDEAAAVRQLRDEGESLSGLCRIVYGFKDGDTFGWIKDALEGTSDDSFGTLDLNTEAGRAALRELQQSGALRLPDDSRFYTEA